MREDADPAAVLGLLEDEYARRILTRTSAQPMTAEQLANACDASLSTIYRRVDDLEDQGLLESEERLDPGGDHYRRFEAAVESVEVTFDDGDLLVEVERIGDGADRFTRAWERLREDR